MGQDEPTFRGVWFRGEWDGLVPREEYSSQIRDQAIRKNLADELVLAGTSARREAPLRPAHSLVSCSAPPPIVLAHLTMTARSSTGRGGSSGGEGGGGESSSGGGGESEGGEGGDGSVAAVNPSVTAANPERGSADDNGSHRSGGGEGGGGESGG